MNNSRIRGGRELSLRVLALESDWERLIAGILPVKQANSIWRFSRPMRQSDPDQGWKIHVSATVLTAARVLKRIAPALTRSNVLFKAASSLEELQRLNCGIFYGFSQVGKFITVYPRNPAEAVAIARVLDRRLRGLGAPAVPYDLRYKSGSIFYRYGAFGNLEIEQPNGVRQPAVKMPDGNLLPDRREPGEAAPDWVVNPFLGRSGSVSKKTRAPSPLKTTVRVYQAVSQRGKGGVYLAVDTSVNPIRLCILKEGRRHGETNWDGRDGYWRARHEEKVLMTLRAAGVRVPEVYRSFKSGSNYYVAMELVDGVNLHALLQSSKKPISLRDAFRYGIQLAQMIETIHAAGWVWRDCKPLNLLVTKRRSLRPVDFEGACLAVRNDTSPWGTPGYSPKESNDPTIVSRIPEDLYALGATLYHLFTGRPSTPLNPLEGLDRSRQRTPVPIRLLITRLMSDDPGQRPAARTTRRILEQNRQ